VAEKRGREWKGGMGIGGEMDVPSAFRCRKRIDAAVVVFAFYYRPTVFNLMLFNSERPTKTVHTLLT